MRRNPDISEASVDSLLRLVDTVMTVGITVLVLLIVGAALWGT